jgi:hypothetical protein
MKCCVLFFTALFSGAVASAQQETTIQMQCREVAAGEALRSEETLIGGKACKPVKQGSEPKAATPVAPVASEQSANPGPQAANSNTAPPVADPKKDTPTQPMVIRQCLILKRMGPADQITSHMYSFGVRGKQFQYVEGDFPPGTKFHGRLTDNDVRNIQSHNAKVVIMEPKYSADDLREAKQSCKQP